MRDGPKKRLGVRWFVFGSMFSVCLCFFCARRFNFVTENYSSYRPYRNLLLISPGLYNFVKGFREAYKPRSVVYNCTKKSVANASYVTVLIKILFEFTPFFKLQNVVKIYSILVQIRRGLISVGLLPGCICLFTEMDRKLGKLASVCVCGGGGEGLISGSLWYLKWLSIVGKR